MGGGVGFNGFQIHSAPLLRSLQLRNYPRKSKNRRAFAPLNTSAQGLVFICLLVADYTARSLLDVWGNS